MHLTKYYPGERDKEALLDVKESFSGVSVYDGESFLYSYLTDAALSGSQMDVLLKKLRKVPMITVHQSKGCEFSTVILVGATDESFPTKMAKGTPLEEEEKRVFYVAITRAKERLIITRPTHVGGRDVSASPYVRNIPEEYLWENKRFSGDL